MTQQENASKKSVRISEVANGILMQRQSLSTYLNMETGKTVMVTHEIVQMAEGDYSLDYYSEWWQEVVEFTQDLLVNKGPDKKYLELPELEQIINETVMNDFCKTVEDPVSGKIKRYVYKEIALEKFERTIEKYELQDKWATFRKIALHKASIQWCNEMDIPFILE